MGGTATDGSYTFAFDRLLSEIRDEIGQSNQYLAKLVGTPPPSASGAAVSPTPVVAIPVDPEVVNRILTFARFLGVAQTVLFTVSLTCPPGPTPTTFSFQIPANKVDLFVQSGRVVTDYASPSLLVDLNIDGADLTPPPFEAALVEPSLPIELGQFYYAQSGIQLNITNQTQTTAHVSASLGVLRLDQDFFFNRFYQPLIRRQVELAQQYAAGASS
jgi:hypothetical protein